MSSSKVKLYKDIFEAIRLTQRSNRFVGSAHDSELSIAESHLLVELAIDSSRSLRTIAGLLGLNTSSISRSVISLTERGLLTTHTSPSHRGRLEISLSKRGIAVLESFDTAAERSTSALCAHLSKKEYALFFELVTGMANGLGVPDSGSRHGEHPLRGPIRRVTRGLGLLGPRVFKVGDCCALHWHILSEISAAKVMTASLLASLLGETLNAISASLRALQLRHAIKKKQDANDKRRQQLILTSKGYALLREIEEHGGKLLAQALRSFSLQEVESLSTLLRKFAMGGLVPVQLQSLSPLIRLLESHELDGARGLLIAELVKNDSHMSAPSTLVSETSLNVGLFVGGTLKGLVEIQRRDESWYLSMFATFINTSDEFGSVLTRQAVELFFLRYPLVVLNIDSSFLGTDHLTTIMGKRASNGFLTKESLH